MDESRVGVARDYCRALTKVSARNFYHGIRLLPAERRDALCAVYAYARNIDDVADGEGDLSSKRAGLDRLRAQLEDLPAHLDPSCIALADACRRHPIPLEAFGEMLDGVTCDLTPISYPTWSDTLQYCRRVGGTVGRLCMAVYPDTGRPEAVVLAERLWVGMQLTNILRDVVEDACMGRVYLPGEDLLEHGVRAPDLDGGGFVDGPGFRSLIRFEAQRAAELLEDGLCVLALLDTRSAACMGTMAGIYRRILHLIRADPGRVLHSRVSLPNHEKSALAVRALLRSPLWQSEATANR